VYQLLLLACKGGGFMVRQRNTDTYLSLLHRSEVGYRC
jgi:hypothetical protein